jgi:hypothetical protein
MGASLKPIHCSRAVRLKAVYPSLPATAGLIRNLFIIYWLYKGSCWALFACNMARNTPKQNSLNLKLVITLFIKKFTCRTWSGANKKCNYNQLL